MRRLPVDRPEQSNEMKLGKARLVGDLVKLDIRTEVLIDKQFRPNRSEIKVLPGVQFHAISIIL